MKKFTYLFLLILLQSCWGTFDDGPSQIGPQSNYTAVFMDRVDFELAVSLQNSNPIVKSGKIYVYNDYLFINEKNKGFHVYDNSDTSNPVPINFIKAPGATDMAIKNDVVYINQATDLIAVELDANMLSVLVTKRVQNVFPEKLSPEGFYESTPNGKVLVNWILN